VTGAARGTGAATAEVFVAEGAQVVLGDVNEAGCAAVAEALGPAARAVRLDVGSEDDWRAAVARCEAELGRVDVLVNNAALLHVAALEDTRLADFERLVRVNQIGPFLGIRAVVPAMRRAGGGSIVNVSSVDGLAGKNGVVAYASTKWALRGIAKVAALELGRYGIRVNSVHPGVIDTELLYENPIMRREDLTPVLRTVPLGRMAQPSEVATLALFLAGDESSYCTGGEFIVDGGVTAS